MTVRRVMGVRRQVDGDVGIEIEVEGQRLPHTDEHWNAEHDGSLRGEESREYVLNRPMSLSEARTALDYLAHCFKENKAKIDDTNRTGVHVHVNCQHLSMLELYNFMTLYLILEDVLVRWCGPTREGNHFCLRAKDAEYLLYTLTEALHEGDYRRRFSTDELRYASMNVRALPQYGSLEFRAMRGTKDMDLIYQWAQVLVELREKAKTFDNPIEMIASTSENGFEGFLRHTFSPETVALVTGVEDWQNLLVEGMRRAQEVAYAGDWEEMASFPKRTVGGVTVPSDWNDDFPPTDL